MNIRATTTIGEVATTLPRAVGILESYGIDYCCGGKTSVAEACRAAGVAPEKLLAEIASTTTVGRASESNCGGMSQKDLVAHIVSTHHVFTRYELARLGRLIDKVLSVHGSRHPELLRLENAFRVLYKELDPHMSKEEVMLFPYIVKLEAAGEGGTLDSPPFETIRNPVRRMLSEHETAGELLKTLRDITSGYVAPEDACMSFKTLYAALEQLEEDLHRHIHLENSILFPRALQMEIRRQDSGRMKGEPHEAEVSR